jgi:hypothetical protein
VKRRVVVVVASLLVFCAATAAASAYFVPASVSSAASVSTATLAAPTGLSATGGARITLNWTATSSTYATGTRVYRGTATGGPYSQIAQVSPRTTTTYVDSPPGPGTYYYVVAAYYQQWTSAQTAQVSAARSVIAFVQTAHIGGTTATITATFTTTPVAGNLLVAIAGTRQSSTMTMPLGWTPAIDSGLVAAPHQAIYYKIAGALEPKSVGLVNTAAVSALQIYEYSGATTLLTSGTATGTSLAVGTGSLTTTDAYTLLFGGVVANVGTAFSAWSNGFTEVNDFTAGGGSTKTLFAGAGLLATTAGTYSTAGTNTTSGAWLGQIVAFG